jgi:hypothetical protein
MLNLSPFLGTPIAAQLACAVLFRPPGPVGVHGRIATGVLSPQPCPSGDRSLAHHLRFAVWATGRNQIGETGARTRRFYASKGGEPNVVAGELLGIGTARPMSRPALRFKKLPEAHEADGIAIGGRQMIGRIGVNPALVFGRIGGRGYFARQMAGW